MYDGVVGEGVGVELAAAAGATRADTDNVDDSVAATEEGESDDDVDDDDDDADRASLIFRWRRSMFNELFLWPSKTVNVIVQRVRVRFIAGRG